jgi:hypothetical protein
MSFLLKSVVGLGSVYIAMFAPAMKPGDTPTKATVCAIAARAAMHGEDSGALRAELSAAGCAITFSEEAQHIAASLALPPAAASPPPPPSPRPAGTLTPADLSEPWYGPDPHRRKARKLG